MEHTRAQDIAWDPAPAEHFTGKVWFGPLSHATEDGLNALAVAFEPGARTDWHTHPDGQVLYVVNGAGLVQSADGQTAEISAGDVVYATPGERHWHGARPNSPMTHLSLTTGGATQWEQQKVSDEQYRSRG
ncbi:MAG TPA: cupin domain-containing protein [Actinomycetota bacterium]|nr:cupin domain-containing protein [Actinomycetota bacterium]